MRKGRQNYTHVVVKAAYNWGSHGSGSATRHSLGEDGAAGSQLALGLGAGMRRHYMNQLLLANGAEHGQRPVPHLLLYNVWPGSTSTKASGPMRQAAG